MGPVVYRSPILIDAIFARPTALCAPKCVERSGQIEGTEGTCDPRRPKGLVMATQGHGKRPAAASGRRTLGKKYRTTIFYLINNIEYYKNEDGNEKQSYGRPGSHVQLRPRAHTTRERSPFARLEGAPHG